MATKKECDRCKVQWDMHNPETDYDATDTKTCIVEIYIPATRAVKTLNGYQNRDRIKTTLELCQNCAREAYDFLKKGPENDVQKG